ncbi:hypothetical protein [Streptosporangium sp. LJ11]|uniref:hypothetical protein n=1 Tax=Streptosporangium sp. LJ11 TaxID=3436927 RepID=UPI003F7B35B1
MKDTEERNGCGAGCLVILIVALLPPALLLATLLGVTTFDGALLEIRAAKREGTMGVFTAEEVRCQGRGPCRWWGSYLPDDGLSGRQEVWIHGYETHERELSVGDGVPALDAGHEFKVHRPGYFDPLGPLLLGTSALLLLLGPGYLVRRALWRRRPSASPPA